MGDIERISPALKSKRNPIYKKTDRKMALILFYTMLPAFTASLAGAIVFNSMVICLSLDCCSIDIKNNNKKILEMSRL